jgi:hypothetical protein
LRTLSLKKREEGCARISKSGVYIIYDDEKDKYAIKYYVVKFDSDDSNRKDISDLEFNRIYYERENIIL